MTPEFSEFSYGFAFTHEYINRATGLKAAPELPSLIREAESGYDLKLKYRGHAKFFQFKLAAYMQRRNALHWSHHGAPHYRVLIASRVRPNRSHGTDQHSRLKRLAETVDHVNYVAPKFHRLEDFNQFFVSKGVTTNSVWVPLKDLPSTTDNDVHYLTFDESQTLPFWHSDALRLEGRFTADEHYETIQERVTIDEDYFRVLRSRLVEALGGSSVKSADDEIANVLKDTYRLLTTEYGLRMVTLIEDDK